METTPKTLSGLKIEAYDLIRQAEFCNQRLVMVNNEIAKEELRLRTENSKPKDSLKNKK